MDDIEDFIPTPAKIVPFHSEEEILGQEGDVFFVGKFRNVGSAVLSVQALPMLYQARYREHEAGRIKSEIESIISQIEGSAAAQPGTGATTENTLLKEFFPNMLYCRRDPRAFKTAEDAFREFMKQYRYLEDVEAVVALIGGPRDLTEKENRLLELYAKKIGSVKNENFSAAEDADREIRRLRGGSS
jgi:hypothetical protein